MKKRLLSAALISAMLSLFIPGTAYCAESGENIVFKNSSGTYGVSEEIPADCGEMLLYPNKIAALSSVNSLNINIAAGSGGYVEMNLDEYDITDGALRFGLPNGFPGAGSYTVTAAGLIDETGAAIEKIEQTVTVTGTGAGSTYQKIASKYSANGTALTVEGCGLRQKAGDGIKLDIYDKGNNVVFTGTQLALIGGKFSVSASVPSYGKYRLVLTDLALEKSENITVFVTETPCVLSTDIKGENPGNIGYMSSAVKFGVSVNAVGAGTADISRSFSVYSGEEDITDSAEISVRNADGLNYEVTVDLSEYAAPYGFFTLRSDILNGVTGERLVKNTHFSVANGSADGVLNDKFGANCHYMFDANDGNSAKYNLFKNGGFSYVRADIVKGLCKADFELNATQKAFLAETAEKGITPYIDLVDQTSKDREYPPVSETAFAEWEQFVYRVVEQTKQYTNYYEVWNEYSLLPENATPANYVKLLECTYRGAKRANPDCVLYGLALANTSDAIEWATEVFRLGGGAYMDGVSFHPYSNYKSPEDGNFTEFYDSLKAAMETYNCGDKPIMASEYGWSSNIFSEEKQAWFLARAAALTYDRLERVLWYVMTEKTWSSATENKFGITHPATDGELPFEAKPAYLALVNFNTMLNGYELKTKNVSDNVYDYEFEKDNYKIHMLWTKKGTEEYTKYETGTQAFDIYGNPISVGTYTLSGSPIYVVTDMSARDNVICSTDFEGEILPEFSGFTAADTGDEGYGKAAKTPSGSDYFWYTPVREITSKALVSFDYKNASDSNSYNIIYFRMYDVNGNTKNIEVWNGGGKLNMYSNRAYSQLWNFEKNKWYSFDFLFDFKAKRINAYVNGELYDYREMTDEISNMHFIGFPRGSEGFYDNFRVTEYADNAVYATGSDYAQGDEYVKVRFSEAFAAASFDASGVRLVNTETMGNAVSGTPIIKGRALFIPVDDFVFDTEYLLILPENTVGITGKSFSAEKPVIFVESDIPKIGKTAFCEDFEDTENLSGFKASMVVSADEKHGNVLNITTSGTESSDYPTVANTAYKLENLTDKAIVKFDIRRTKDTSVSNGYKLQLVLRSTGEKTADTYFVVTNDDKAGFSGKTTALTDGWHTVTICFNYANNTVDGWLDSAYFGRQSIGEMGKTYYPHSFHVVARKNTGLEFQLDNLRIGEEKILETGFFARGLSITDAYGDAVSGLSENNLSRVYASAYLVNLCDTDEMAKFILGLYRGGSLKMLKTADVDVAAGKTRYVSPADNISIELPQDVKNCVVKAFCWNSNGIAPLHGDEIAGE